MFGQIKNSQNENLDYTVHPGNSGDYIVVLGHGVTGNKDRPFLVALANGLSKLGITTLRFSFSGNGNSEGSFGEATITKEVEDLKGVLNSLKGNRICYVGHSMGGAVGVILASQDDRIHYLVSLAGMVDTKGFVKREFGDITPGVDGMWGDLDFPLSQAYIDDLVTIETVVGKAIDIVIPWLLVHGTEDDVVPLKDSKEIFSRANYPKKLVKLPGADHVFSEKSSSTMVETVIQWISLQFSYQEN